MQEVFGNVERIALDKGYWILVSTKKERGIEMEKIEEKKSKNPKKPKKKFNWRIFLATILFIIAGVLFAAGPIRTFLLSRLQSQQIEAASNTL